MLFLKKTDETYRSYAYAQTKGHNIPSLAETKPLQSCWHLGTIWTVRQTGPVLGRG